MPLRPFVAIPKDLREWTRWCEDQNINAEDDSVTTAQIQDGAVTLAKLADMTADRILGRLSTAGVPTELTAAQVATLLETAIEALDLDLTGNIGFHGTAANGQQSDPGAPSISTVTGSGDDATINANFAALESAINGIRTILNNKGLSA